MLPSATTLFIALLVGILPALLWLWFWIREDRKHPEPRGLIILTFLGGVVAIPLVILVQKSIGLLFAGALVVILWAAVEELFKVGAAYLIALRNRAMNEPLDAIIYMITAALGFAALENALFVLVPLSNGFFVETFLTGNFRFIGAMLLHTLTSATVGIFIALSFYKRRAVRRLWTLFGIVLATVLHALFNFLILKSNGGAVLLSFFLVWVGIIIVILVLERIKRMRAPRTLLET